MFALTETYEKVQQHPCDTVFTIFVAVWCALIVFAFLYAIFSIFFLDKVKKWWYNKFTKRKGE